MNDNISIENAQSVVAVAQTKRYGGAVRWVRSGDRVT